MKASNRIKEFIKQHEGLRLRSYLCPAKVWTIGYGHTGADVVRDMTITHAQAERLFEADLAAFEADLAPRVAPLSLSQGQYDALLSFAYNVGIRALLTSTLWRKVKANVNDPTIADEFKRWVYAGGVKLPGLINRRKGEAKIWQEQ